jgi:hypothetical protein
MTEPTSTVYVVQERKKLDIRPAAEYGDVVQLLPEHEQCYDMDAAVRRVFSKLHKFSERDYILPIGHPVAIAIAVAIATRLNGGRAKLLVWDGAPGVRRYYSTQVDLGSITPQKEIRL